MPLLNFKKQFVEPIRDGRKHHTIRAWRKRPIRQGDKLFLYCGARHKGAFRILPDAVICTKVETIQIRARGWNSALESTILLDGSNLDKSEKEQLARADGFESLAEMIKFWLTEHGDVGGPLHMCVVSFDGQIIHWRQA